MSVLLTKVIIEMLHGSQDFKIQVYILENAKNRNMTVPSAQKLQITLTK